MINDSLMYVVGKIINDTSGSISLLVIFSSLAYFIWMVAENKGKKKNKIITLFGLLPIITLLPTIWYLLRTFSIEMSKAGYSDVLGYFWAGVIIAICFALSVFTVYGAYDSFTKSDSK